MEYPAVLIVLNETELRSIIDALEGSEAAELLDRLRTALSEMKTAEGEFPQPPSR